MARGVAVEDRTAAPTRPCAIGPRQIVEAYAARGQRADVHSREDGAANSRVMQKLDNHDLGVPFNRLRVRAWGPSSCMLHSSLSECVTLDCGRLL
jgi:hypothetical protein